MQRGKRGVFEFRQGPNQARHCLGAPLGEEIALLFSDED